MKYSPISHANSLSGRLLSGVGLAAIVCSSTALLGAVPSNAEPDIRSIETGASGRDQIRYSDPATTPGGTGPSINRTLASLVMMEWETKGYYRKGQENSVAIGDAVEIGSIGGNGGAAGDGDSRIVGKPGGNGGAVSVLVNGAVTGTYKAGPDKVEIMVSATRSRKVGKRTIVEQYQRPQTVSTQLFPTRPLISIYSIGGNGGTSLERVGQGGNGGKVNVTLSGTASSNGRDAPIVLVRSIGGADHTYKAGVPHGATQQRVKIDNGGDGGNVAVDITASGKISADGHGSPGLIAESRGGHGGTTGNASDSAPLASAGGNGTGVAFTSNGEISTKGNRSIGVILQSVGGLGGENSARKGGYPGGDGGNAGHVEATLGASSKITTSGDYAFGLIAQSIGGAGGKGAPGFLVGGDGGAAGNGGNVDVRNAGSIETAGLGAVGILAQSTGGGTGGAVQIGKIAKIDNGGGGSGGGGGFLFFGGGGQGGNGGAGRKVSVTNSGSIATTGEAAFGILAQSIGGSGGTGGKGSSYGFQLGGSTGGDGGGGGNGGTVVVGTESKDPTIAILPSTNSTDTITTTGKAASAIVGQSVGGGGGFGGTASSNTAGVFLSLSFAVGGDGGKGGSGGSAKVYNSSLLSTKGNASHGIEVRSVGGGGGKAGNAAAYAISGAPPGYPSLAISFAVGGTGGNGGSADLAKAVNRADISTAGRQAYGIFAQSIGGGGGTAGSAQAIADTVGLYKNLDVAIALGGKAGGGGDGGESKIINAGTVTTKGDFSTAILGSSVGGGGGDGGLATSTTEKNLSSFISNPTLGAVNAGKTVGISGALGGTGGKGGAGKTVIVDNLSAVSTKGVQASGIFAQSVGGGGGNAGGYVSKGSKDLALNIGGTRSKDDKDGGGGAGGSVTVTNATDATISTKGAGATAIYAQSIGGGGGLGGSWGGTQDAPKLSLGTVKGIITAAKTGWSAWKGKLFETKETVDPAVSLARKAAAFSQAKGLWSNVTGFGDTGSAFYTALKKDIQDQLKPLIGEIKKEGKFPLTLSVAVGGGGGKGGAGGNVEVKNAGSVTTGGGSAYGTFAQSIGGGGGFGGGAVGSSSSTFSAQLTIGGTGGDGGTSGRVEATNSGTITTKGVASIGLFGQSIGGGGGVGGAAANASVFSGAAGVSLGGSSGKFSNAGSVIVENSGTVSTQGKEAHGLVAQSIGGGGGVYFAKKEGMIDAGEIQKLINEDPQFKQKQITDEEAQALVESLVEWLGVGAPQTQTVRSPQIFDSFSVTAMLGGRAFTGGNGGAANVTHSGTVLTEGIGALGIFAQSIGGGGGFGSDASVLDRANSKWSFGGTDGVRGDGGSVNLTFAGNSVVRTAGAGATGVFLQSIGGGGGYGGTGGGSFSIVDATRHTEYIPDPDGFGSGGYYQSLYYGNFGNGGPIKVSMRDGANAAITTTGTRAHGIFAQSLGAGGGMAFVTDGVNLPVSSSANGRSSEMEGNGGSVTIDTKGDIRATGAGSYGIFIQSGVQKADGTLDSDRLGDTVTVTHAGEIKGGSGDGAAIRIDGGRLNDITLRPGSVVGAASGKAIMGSHGRETVANWGTLIGDVDLISGGTNEANDFSNNVGATYQSKTGDSVLKLGAGGRFTNSGALDVAGAGRIGTLTIAPGIMTRLGGSLLADVNSIAGASKPRSDLLRAETITLEGVTVRPRAVEGLLPGSFTVISANRLDDLSGGGKSPAVTAAANPGSPFSWSATLRGTEVSVSPSASFAKAAQRELTPTEQAVVNTWQNAWDKGSVDKAGLFAKLANVTSVQDYQAAIDSTSPEGQQQPAVSQTMSARTSMNSAMSCPIFIDAGTTIGESQCAWARVTGSRSQTFESGSTDGFTHRGIDFRVGAQWEVTQDWFLGATAAYSTTSGSSSDGFTATDGKGGDISIALKHQRGPWLMAGSLHLGYSSNDIFNRFDVGDAIWNTRNNADILAGGAKGRVAYELAFPTWYLRPSLDVDLIYTSMSGYNVQGDLFSLKVGRMQDWTLAIRPAVEVGTRIDIGEHGWLRPYATFGFSYFSGEGPGTNVEIYDDAPDGHIFSSAPAMPDTLFDIGAGLQLFAQDKYEVRGEYKAQIGDNFLSHDASLRLSVKF